MLVCTPYAIRPSVGPEVSQEELAREADLHPTYVGLIERGLRNPTIEVGHALALALARHYRPFWGIGPFRMGLGGGALRGVGFFAGFGVGGLPPPVFPSSM